MGMEMPESADLVDRLIEQAKDEGLFDDLAGAGRPIPDIDRPYDPAWWARTWIERDGAQQRANGLRARLRREVPRALGAPTRDEARRRLEELNAVIAASNAKETSSDPIEQIEIERLLDSWD